MPALVDKYGVDLVLCRLGTEDVNWAILAAAATTAKHVQLIIYNAGPPLTTSQWAQEVIEKTTVRKLEQAGGHEAYCYIEHIQRTLRGNGLGGGAAQGGFAGITVFAPAQLRCAHGTGYACVPRLQKALHSFANEGATLQPNGYAPIEPAPIDDFWEGMQRSLTCLPKTYFRLSQGRDLQADSEFISFSRFGSMAVGRRNLLSAPRGWLRRASEALRNATDMHLLPYKQGAAYIPPQEAMINQCCLPGHTCMPWLLERLWPMMLGTPHRGCNGVLTGYCANEWAPKASGKPGAYPTMVPREGAGAIKLRLDVARVARVARFANDLDDNERARVMELLAAERAAPKGGTPMCSTQLCAILSLLDKARASDDSDFALYLASAINSTDSFVAPERSQRRCRQLFVDKKVLLQGIERIHVPTRMAATGGTPKDRETELQHGKVLHTAIQKMYAACLAQMDADPRWYQRPFVYGFAKEADRPLPNVA